MAMRAHIKAVSSFLPQAVETNDDLAGEFPAWGVDKIHAKTGISTRRIAGPDECASDLGVAAARKLFDQGGVDPSGVDFLLFCTQSPDYILPTTACLVQDRLGLARSCGALDFNLGCSGFVYGLSLAKGLVETGSAENVLLVTAETYSKHIHARDKSARTIFGDGAAATMVSAAERDGAGIGPFVFGTDGSGGENLIIRAGAARMPRSESTAREVEDESGNVRSHDHIFMNGPEIFNFALDVVPRAYRDLCEKAQIDTEGVAYFVFHQANGFMLEALRRKLRLPRERFCISMQDCGNTVSATIPMALAGAIASGQIRPGDTVVLVGFGVGYSWAACVVKF